MPERDSLPRLSTPQRTALEAIQRGDVIYMPGGAYYRRRDVRGGVHVATMDYLLRHALATRPARQLGHFGAITGELTALGKEALGA